MSKDKIIYQVLDERKFGQESYDDLIKKCMEKYAAELLAQKKDELRKWVKNNEEQSGASDDDEFYIRATNLFEQINKL